jgi:hypothetical protein
MVLWYRKQRDVHRDLNLREGPSGPRCVRRAAHARRGNKSRAESEAKIAQGRSSSKVTCTLTGLERPSGGGAAPKNQLLTATESSMTRCITV